MHRLSYLLWLVLAGICSAENWRSEITNKVIASTTFASVEGSTLRLDGGPLVVSATVSSPSNHITSQTIVYLQFTADGTNWTSTNSANTLVATTLLRTTNYTIASNFTTGGFTGARWAGWVGNTATNIVLTNLTIGTWNKN